jgi:hypothetical protein
MRIAIEPEKSEKELQRDIRAAKNKLEEADVAV